jgi:hypothetical protein
LQSLKQVPQRYSSENTSAVFRTEGMSRNGNLLIEALRDSFAILFLLS